MEQTEVSSSEIKARVIRVYKHSFRITSNFSVSTKYYVFFPFY